MTAKLNSLFFLSVILLFPFILIGSCAQIGLPTGGVKDTLAPVLIKAIPDNKSINVQSPYLSFTFNEYINVEDLQQNLIISPLQNKNPNITANPKTINLKFRDSLLPNTTYTLNFGDAIKDNNEGNILKNLPLLIILCDVFFVVGLPGIVISRIFSPSLSSFKLSNI